MPRRPARSCREFRDPCSAFLLSETSSTPKITSAPPTACTAGERLVQPERAGHRDAHRAERADQREVVGADALERLGLQEDRQHGAEASRARSRSPTPRRAAASAARRFQHEELDHRGHRGDHHRVGGEAHRADALHQLAAGDEIDRVAERARRTPAARRTGTGGLRRARRPGSRPPARCRRSSAPARRARAASAACAGRGTTAAPPASGRGTGSAGRRRRRPIAGR